MRPYADKINRLTETASDALYDALATRIAAKQGFDFAQVREYGAPGGGPNKDDFRRDADCILDLLANSQLALGEIEAVLVEHGVAE